MFARKVMIIAGVMAVVFTGCGDEDGNGMLVEPVSKIMTVDELLARVCELAADCVDATEAEISACPADLLQKLDADEIAELERFTTLDKSEQDRILECFDAAICGRFGGDLGNMSDSDLMEPLRACE